VRVLLTKIGLDGHDRGLRVVARALRDAGLEVIYLGPWADLGAVVQAAIEEDVAAVGVSSLAYDHLLVPDLVARLRSGGWEGLVVVGGIVQQADVAMLEAAGVGRVFHPDEPLPLIAEYLRAAVGANGTSTGMVGVNGKDRPASPASDHPPPPSRVANRSGIALKTVYRSEDADTARVGEPGQPPFTRGIHADMYRGRPWSKRQLIGLDTPESFNERQLALISAGQTAVNLTTCNSTYRGLDIDQVPEALVGTCGTPINCQEDVRIAFRDMRLSDVSFGLNDPTPFTIAARLLVLAEERGEPWSAIRGTSNQSDAISHYVANHMFLRLPLRQSIRVLVDHIKFVSDRVPGWNPVSVVGQHMQQAGATPVQALAFTLCTAIEYVDAAVSAGLDVDTFGRRVTFFHDISMSLFEEAAKLRAQRRMWAAILRDRFHARDPKTLRFKVHTQTSGADLVQTEPLNNIVRVTVQALAAILGGTQSLHTDAYDEAYGTPTEEAARLALMTQHILAEETGVAEVVDPLGGSYYVEALTNDMEAKAWAIVEEIDALGGMVAACEQGWVQREIGRSAWEYQRQVEGGQRKIVGVNAYAAPGSALRADMPVQRVDRARVNTQIERVRRSRMDRDASLADRARDRILGLAADEGDNAFAAVIDGVRAGLTHGEIVGAMRTTFGEGRPLAVV